MKHSEGQFKPITIINEDGSRRLSKNLVIGEPIVIDRDRGIIKLPENLECRERRGIIKLRDYVFYD